MTASIGGWLLVLALALPAVGVLLAIGAGGRWPERIALVAAPVGFVVALAITIAVLRSGDAVTYVLGGWLPPLGVALRADGLSAAMLLTTAVTSSIAADRPSARRAMPSGGIQPPRT